MTSVFSLHNTYLMKNLAHKESTGTEVTYNLLIRNNITKIYASLWILMYEATNPPDTCAFALQLRADYESQIMLLKE